MSNHQVSHRVPYDKGDQSSEEAGASKETFHHMTDQFKQEFYKRIYYPFLQVQAQHEVLRHIPANSHREVLSVLAYDIWRCALSGFIINLDSFCKELIKFLQEVKAGHRDKVKRNYWKDISEDPTEGVVIGVSDPELQKAILRDMAIHFTKQRRESYKKLWDKLFPSPESGKNGFPCDQDLDGLIAQIRDASKGISDHRNTVAAHPEDPNPKPTTWDEVNRCVVFLKELVGDFGLVLFDISLGMEPGYMGGDPKDIGESLADLIYFDGEAGEQSNPADPQAGG